MAIYNPANDAAETSSPIEAPRAAAPSPISQAPATGTHDASADPGGGTARKTPRPVEFAERRATQADEKVKAAEQRLKAARAEAAKARRDVKRLEREWDRRERARDRENDIKELAKLRDRLAKGRVRTASGEMVPGVEALMRMAERELLPRLVTSDEAEGGRDDE